MRLIIVVVALFLLANPAGAMPPEAWRADIRQVVELIEGTHPNPYTHISRDEFMQRADALMATVDERPDIDIAVELMALVAAIHDGHTTLHGSEQAGFTRWLPLSFYEFEDGVFVISAHRDLAHLTGRQIDAIGGTDVESLLPRVSALMGSDNEFGARQNIHYLASADALKALGVIEDVSTVRITSTGPDGERQNFDVETVESQFVLDESRFWGEMFAPVDDDTLLEFVMPFDNLTLVEFMRATADEKRQLALHVRHRPAYWSMHLPAESTYYMQIGHVTSAGRGGYESFEAFYRSAFEFLRENPVDRFVLDIRYNSGGDGSILIPFVHEFIRNDLVNRRGHLFTIIGRKTYSAATMLVDLMLKHTNTLLVGEPAGSALNGYGDPMTFRLANSEMTLDVSSEYWKLVHTDESPPLMPIDIPAVFTSEDYFGGRDPALDRILAIEPPYRSVDEVLGTDGGPAATRRYLADKEAFGRYAWWRPFDESTLRKVARAYTDAGNFGDGIAGFEILVDAYPESWRAWRDFGKARIAENRTGDAIECLRRARALNPGDTEVNALLDDLGGES